MKAEVDALRYIINNFDGAKKENAGLKLIWSDTYSTAYYMGKKLVRNPADIVGVKIGCDGMRQEVVQSIGGTPVYTIPPLMYQQLQTGVVSGVLVSIGAAGDWQLQEQVKYCLDWSTGGSQMANIMNMDSYNKMDDASKKIWDDLCVQAEEMNRQVLVETAATNWPKFKNAGVQVFKPSADDQAAWMAKYKVVWEKWVVDMKAKGYTDAQQIFDYWQKAVNTPR